MSDFRPPAPWERPQVASSQDSAEERTDPAPRPEPSPARVEPRPAAVEATPDARHVEPPQVPQPTVPRTSEVAPVGVGVDVFGGTPIATIPVQQVAAPQSYPISEKTGEPRRPVMIMVSVILAWVSVAILAGAFAWWWWQAASVTHFHDSARILTWTHPDPVSALAIVMVLVVGVMMVLMVCAAGMVAYNAWAGAKWVRIGGLIAIAVLGLSFLMNWWFSAAMIPLVAAVVLVWLPPSTRFFKAMAAYAALPVVEVPTTNILYGPQPLVGMRGANHQ